MGNDTSEGIMMTATPLARDGTKNIEFPLSRNHGQCFQEPATGRERSRRSMLFGVIWCGPKNNLCCCLLHLSTRTTVTPDTSKVTRRGSGKTVGNIRMPLLGPDGPARAWAEVVTLIAYFKCLIPFLTPIQLPRRSCTALSHTLSPPTFIVSPHTPGKAAGHGIPARQAGSTAWVSRPYSDCAAKGSFCTLPPVFLNCGRRFESNTRLVKPFTRSRC